MIRICRAIARRVQRWYHVAAMKDMTYCIGHHERMLLALPAEIRRLYEIQRYHAGRAATLVQERDPVNFHLAGMRRVK